MKTETFEGTVDTVGGKKLPETLRFDVIVELFESHAEMMAAKAGLTPKEQLKARNTQLRNKARASAQEAALEAAGIEKPTLENSEDMRVANMAKSFIAKGMSVEKARAKAAKILAELDSDTDDDIEPTEPAPKLVKKPK